MKESSELKKERRITMLAVFGSFLLAFGAFLWWYNAVIAQSGGEAPQIDGIKVLSLNATSSLISWKTDEESDSMVQYGLDKKYGQQRDPIPNKKNHIILLTDLVPSTEYFYRVISTDGTGNQTISGDFSFITPGLITSPEIEAIQDEKQKALVQKILELLAQIRDPAALEIIAEKLRELADKVVPPPSIIGAPKVDDIGSDGATISWNTDREANSLVALVVDENYDPEAEDPYIEIQGDEAEQVIEHRVVVSGLREATKYHFQVRSAGPVGPQGKSVDSTFTTKAVLPKIQSVNLTKIEEESATFAVSTNIPTNVIIEYTNLQTKEVKIKGDPTFLTSHTVKVDDLTLGASYSAIVKVENQIGDKEVSDPITFVTVKDVTPPVIAKVTNESTLFPTEDVKIQTIVGWETDEPATCKFSYIAGLIPGGDVASSDEELNPTDKHVQVITALAPSSVYKFWVECKDRSDNPARSEDFVLVTPTKEKNIIDIILENFQGTFGWVKNIGG